MRTPTPTLSLVILFAVLAGGLDPCVDVDVDRHVSEWQCDMHKRSYATTSVERFFSICAGATFNIGVSCVNGTVDFTFAVVNGLWHVFLLACSWLFSVIGTLWQWWYVSMWDVIVVAAWDKFFLLGILAFLAYLLWAALGVFVCLAATLLGLVVVAIMFVLTVILIAILFVLGVFPDRICHTLGHSGGSAGHVLGHRHHSRPFLLGVDGANGHLSLLCKTSSSVRVQSSEGHQTTRQSCEGHLLLARDMFWAFMYLHH